MTPNTDECFESLVALSEHCRRQQEASNDVWTAPQEAGEYRIAALVSSDGVTAGSFRGSIAVRVAAP